MRAGRRGGGVPIRPTAAQRLIAWAARFEDGQILRAAFFGMLTATICVLVIDYQELDARDAVAAASKAPDLPILPAFDPDDPGGKPGPAITTDPAILEKPLAISLGAGGTLQLVGTIDSGAAARFAAEIGVHGEYVKTVALDSPGGSLEDALQMGRLIRDKGFSTSVAPGALCASSCPLVLAGGKKRIASFKSAIGVHQFYLSAPDDVKLAGGKSASLMLEQTQKTTARITRYLIEMGVDPATWLNALETPPGQIYYFSGGELLALKLVTNLNDQLTAAEPIRP